MRSKAGLSPGSRLLLACGVVRWSAVGVLATTFGLLAMSGCSGGWGDLKPTVAVQGHGETVTAGQRATFTVTATGTGPFTYQWYVNGVAINGATSNSYTTPATNMSNNGSVYTVSVTNAGGTVMSPGYPLSVNPKVPTLAFAPVASQAYGAAPLTVSATSASSGAVTYSVISGPATISGDTVTLTGVGTVVLGASQAANGNYTAATATTSFAVAPKVPTLAFASIASQTYSAAPFAVSATSASSGAVTYSVISGPATIAGNTVTLTGVGTVVLGASQAANGNYAAAAASTSFTVGAEAPMLAFTSIAPQTYGAAPFAVSATSASSGVVTYSVTSGPATISGNTVTLTGVGTVVLGAQAGSQRELCGCNRDYQLHRGCECEYHTDWPSQFDYGSWATDI